MGIFSISAVHRFNLDLDPDPLRSRVPVERTGFCLVTLR
jgi:hypothetical protein